MHSEAGFLLPVYRLGSMPECAETAPGQLGVLWPTRRPDPEVWAGRTVDTALARHHDDGFIKCQRNGWSSLPR